MMSSSPSSFSAPAMVNSKRHSLNISIGPRPLHLVDGNVSSLFQFQSGPTTAPLAPSRYPLSPEFSTPPSSSKKFDGFNHKPRRQSSISYNPRDRNAERDLTPRSPLSTPRFTLSRSNSLGPKVANPVSTSGDRRSVGSEVSAGTQERPPLTLAEKHSELLHFIAQKESKCLELRSQLAVHEAELLQLKRKWERIVSRDKVPSDATSPTAQGQGSGAMLEGIREGVQGVSRFITAGLAIGELSAPSPSPSPLPTTRPMRRNHSSSSNSSISTSTTKSTRFSQSSASSIGEEPSPPMSAPSEDVDTVQVLMVYDTGATPTMSPNPAFMHKQQQLQEHQDELARTPSSFEIQRDMSITSSPITASKIHRRKSRDVTTLGDVFASPQGSSSPRSASPSNDPSAKREATKAKRASLNGSAFPPVSSIPGLGSIAAGASSPPVSSWVGTVGKKWEELQRGSSFSKNQKRASILFSDVSHSIVSALSAPPTSTSISTTTSASLASPPPPYYNPNPTSPITASTTSNSLLDDDDSGGFLGSSSILTPDTKPQLTPKPTPHIQLSQPPPRTRTGLDPSKSKPKDDDDEWNW